MYLIYLGLPKRCTRLQSGFMLSGKSSQAALLVVEDSCLVEPSSRVCSVSAHQPCSTSTAMVEGFGLVQRRFEYEPTSIK